MIGHLARVLQSKIRERAKKKKRSPHWDNVQRAFLKAHPTCAACGGTKNLQVHHIEPYSNKPERELDPTNLIVMCMHKNECHLRLAHGGAFKFYDPKIVEHAAEALAAPEKRKEIEYKAKRGRQD